MSIFPRYVARGSAVTIHHRITRLPFSYNASGFVERSLLLRSPDGRLQELVEAPAWLTGAPFPAGMTEASPPLLLLTDQPDAAAASDATARDLHADPGTTSASNEDPIAALGAEMRARMSPLEHHRMLGELGVLRHSFHYYHVYQVAEDALLGRYGVVPRTARRGIVGQSSTLAWDFFLVERLDVVLVERVAGGLHATIANPSPHECVARLIMRTAPERVEACFLRCPPERDTHVDLPATGGLLFYGDRPSPLLLSACADDRLIWRDQKRPASVAADGTVRVSAAGTMPAEPVCQDDTLILHGDHARAWLAADGFRLESELRTRVSPEVIEELCTAGLLLASGERLPGSAQ